MSVSASYKVLVDWDRDAFFCEGVLTTDPLNLVPGCVTWHGLPYRSMTSNSTVTLGYSESDLNDQQLLYGYKELTVSNGGDMNGGVRIGRTQTTNVAQTIAVLPNTSYVFQVAVRYVDLHTGAPPLALVVRDQNLVALASSAFTPTPSYAVYSRTFTTGDDTRFVTLDVRKNTTADNAIWKVTGVLLVTGSTPPNRFNAGSASNAYDDITSDVEDSIIFSYGIPAYTEVVSPASAMTLKLKNIDGKYSPEVTSSPLYGFFTRGAMVRVRSDFSFPTNLYTGIVDSYEVSMGTFGDRRTTLTVVDPVPQLTSAQYNAPLQESVTTDQPLTTLFDSGVIAYPYPGLHWLLGVPGASELGTTTWLWENRITDFDTGDTTLAFAGDTTGSGNQNSAIEFIRSIVYAELGGRFFWDGHDEVFKFFKRTRDILNLATPTTLPTLELDEPPRYIWGDDLLNNVTVTYYPRVVGASDTIMYQLGNLPMSLAAGQQRRMTIRYQVDDALNAVVAGRDMNPPVAGLDYSANALEDGTGADVTNTLTVIVTFNAISADVTLINNGGATAYLQVFQLRGTPLISYKPTQANARDGDSISRQGEYKRTLDLPALGDALLAESYANYLVQRYKTPLGRIAQVSLWGNRDTTQMLTVLGMRVGDHVQIADAFVNNQAQKYVVTSMTHSITPTNNHWLLLTVEPLDRYLYWILGDEVLSILGTTTRLSL